MSHSQLTVARLQVEDRLQGSSHAFLPLSTCHLFITTDALPEVVASSLKRKETLWSKMAEGKRPKAAFN